MNKGSSIQLVFDNTISQEVLVNEWRAIKQFRREKTDKSVPFVVGRVRHPIGYTPLPSLKKVTGQKKVYSKPQNKQNFAFNSNSIRRETLTRTTNQNSTPVEIILNHQITEPDSTSGKSIQSPVEKCQEVCDSVHYNSENNINDTNQQKPADDDFSFECNNEENELVLSNGTLSKCLLDQLSDMSITDNKERNTTEDNGDYSIVKNHVDYGLGDQIDFESNENDDVKPNDRLDVDSYDMICSEVKQYENIMMDEEILCNENVGIINDNVDAAGKVISSVPSYAEDSENGHAEDVSENLIPKKKSKKKSKSLRKKKLVPFKDVSNTNSSPYVTRNKLDDEANEKRNVQIAIKADHEICDEDDENNSDGPNFPEKINNSELKTPELNRGRNNDDALSTLRRSVRLSSKKQRGYTSSHLLTTPNCRLCTH